VSLALVGFVVFVVIFCFAGICSVCCEFSFVVFCNGCYRERKP